MPRYSLPEIQPFLTAEESKFLKTSARLLRLPANRIVFQQGDPRQHFFLVAEGNVRIFYHSVTGRKITFCGCGPGDLFGLGDLTPPGIHSANAQTSVASSVWRIPLEQITVIANHYPVLTLRIMTAMSKRLNAIAVLMESLVTMPLRIRVAYFLLKTSDFSQPAAGSGIGGLSHEAMADILGCTRQTLTRILNEFARAGIIRIARKRITILKNSELRKLRESITIEEIVH